MKRNSPTRPSIHAFVGVIALPLFCSLAANLALMAWLHLVEGLPLENLNEDGRFIIATGIGLGVGFIVGIAIAAMPEARIRHYVRKRK